MALTGTFRIIAIDGEPAAGDFELTVGDDDRIHGRVVNRFSGQVEQAEGALVLGPIAATRMMGPPELMAQEDAVFRVLSGSVAVAHEDGEVVLTGEGGAVRLRELDGDLEATPAARGIQL